MWVLALGLAVFAGIRLFGGGGDTGPPAVRMDGGRDRPAPRQAPALYVQVAGAVKRPGVLRVSAEMRVATALERAGGPTNRADLTAINLAAKVQDGQQIVVPVKGATTQASGSPVNLSTATAEQLDEIDGIGPTLAERIVEYRDAHGGFGSIDELGQVDGIGEQRLATLRDALQP